MLRQLVSDRWFALADLVLVSLSGCLWIFKPEIAILPVIILAMLPWVVRLTAGLFPFRRTALDLLVLTFLVTGWVGYWAAYDPEAAWTKVWLICFAVLLYYALASQPTENLELVCILFSCIGLGVSIYFFLAHDFVAQPRKVEIVNEIGRWIMAMRPQFGWTAIHPNYVAGIAAITTPFTLYPLIQPTKNGKGISIFLHIFMILGLGMALLAVFMATSRGVLMAIASACGVWILWQIIDHIHVSHSLRHKVVFPALVLFYLCAVALFLYMGPANVGYASTGYSYSTGSRAELFGRSLSLVFDFPFTGGGLAAFPGLYSYYMLGIPFLNVINSHNLFLDVAIEQGLLGGLAFLVIFLVSIWWMASEIAKTKSPARRRYGWLLLLALIIAFVHGMVDDYLYNGSGTLLALTLVGFSSALQPEYGRTAFPKNYRLFVLVVPVLIALIMTNPNRFRAAWYANLGAVQMSQVELKDFPTGQWATSEIVPRLEMADTLLHTALQSDSSNQTANYRLGLISMLRRDFKTATANLETAYQEEPNHRGIIKSLGYCYVWLGDMDEAQLLLKRIPEAQYEMSVYIWWWGTQGRPDLSQNASIMTSRLDPSSQ
ncbi:MAG TPA: O-antigen ligase family protein [Anaerolineales bacterium]